MQFKDYYKTLGVARDASAEDVPAVVADFMKKNTR